MAANCQKSFRIKFDEIVILGSVLTTRSRSMGIFEKSVQRTEFHHEKLLILRRHRNMVLDIIGKEGYEEMLKQSNKLQKRKIEEYVSKINTKENEERKSIRERTLKDKIATLRM